MPAWTIQKVPGQPHIHSKTLYPTKGRARGVRGTKLMWDTHSPLLTRWKIVSDIGDTGLQLLASALKSRRTKYEVTPAYLTWPILHLCIQWLDLLSEIRISSHVSSDLLVLMFLGSKYKFLKSHRCWSKASRGTAGNPEAWMISGFPGALRHWKSLQDNDPTSDHEVVRTHEEDHMKALKRIHKSPARYYSGL